MGPSAPAPLTTPVLRARWCTPPHAATGLMRPSPVSPDDGGPRPHRQASGLPSWCQRPDRGVTGRRDRRPGPLQGLHHRLSASAWSPPSTPAGQPAGLPGPHHEDPRAPRARRLLIEAARTPRPRLPALQGHTGALGPGPRTGRGTGRCRQPPPARPLPGPDRPRQEARRGRHRHRPRERRLAVVPGNHGRLGPARPPRPARPARPERLNQVRRNHDLTHQTRSPARRGHTGRSAQGAHAQELWAAPRGDARLQTSRAPRRRMVMRQPDPRISD